MQKPLFLLFILTYYAGVSQDSWLLKGKITSNTEEKSSINILNLTKNKGTISDKNGFFEINTTIGDTLVFSSLQYEEVLYVVTEKDLESPNLEIKLKVKVTELDEVRLSQYSLSGDIEKDIDMIPTRTENLPLWSAADLKRLGVSGFNDAQSNVTNLVLEDENNYLKANIDLGMLLGGISKIFKGNRMNSFTPVKNVNDFYTEAFMVKELKIPETEYYNFLDYVNEKLEMQRLLKQEDELKILEFLMEQAVVYRETYKIKP